jgi:large conductance mechanosensitive channel
MKIPLSQLGKEFKAFAFKGNMIDLAVAVIIGAAFGKVVGSLVTHIIMPLVNLLIRLITQSDKPASYQTEWTWGGVQVGAFIGEIVNFMIIALAVFIMMVKVLGLLMKRDKGPPTTKECGSCCSEIPIKATRCKFCTSELAPAK